ncbi:hypothetical protein C8R43DRAFT_1136085 [Mycena crocata]|nr:hypothetical protein C8R43DRAFT_1136085 [Mycena crocata]
MREVRAGIMQDSWAIVVLSDVIALSWGIFRNRYHEVSKLALHFIASGIIMATLLVHVNFILTSWYFHDS